METTVIAGLRHGGGPRSVPWEWTGGLKGELVPGDSSRRSRGNRTQQRQQKLTDEKRVPANPRESRRGPTQRRASGTTVGDLIADALADATRQKQIAEVEKALAEKALQVPTLHRASCRGKTDRKESIEWAVVPEVEVAPEVRRAAAAAREMAERELDPLGFELRWVRRPRWGEQPTDTVRLWGGMFGATGRLGEDGPVAPLDGDGPIYVWLDCERSREQVEATLLHELRHVHQVRHPAGDYEANERDADSFALRAHRRMYGLRSPAEDRRCREDAAQRRWREEFLANWRRS